MVKRQHVISLNLKTNALPAILLLRSILDCNDVEVFTREEIFHKFLTQFIERDQMPLKSRKNFLLLSSGPLREVKTKGNFKLLALKVVAVAYERRSLTRGSKYSDFTWKLSVFWKTVRSKEVVAYERWSQPEIRLYLVYTTQVDSAFGTP